MHGWTRLRGSPTLILPAIICISSFHSAKRSGVPTTSAAMAAPWTGGLLQMARAIRFIWLSTFVALSLSAATKLMAPTRSPYRPVNSIYISSLLNTCHTILLHREDNL